MHELLTKHRNGMERNQSLCRVPSTLNGTEYTGMSRNIPERGRMTPEWKGMDKNGTGMYRNEPEWHRNILKWAGMRLEWKRIWSAEPEKSKMWCFSFPFFFSFFHGGRRGVSRNFREQFYFILTGLLCNDQSEWSWANLKTCILCLLYTSPSPRDA